jgi:putative ABC transport system permease protein
MSRGSRSRAWQVAAAISVGVGVGFSVLLMSVAFGVSYDIHHRLNVPFFQVSPADVAASIARIDTILTLLTAVVAVAMLTETAATTFTVGVVLMRSRRAEIAIRRQSGALRSRLVGEFVVEILKPALVGGVIGEVVGIGVGLVLRHVTVLPVRFTPFSLLAAFPATVLLAVLAALIPAWVAAGKSPNILRREG